jgi:hypothetical protein
MRIPRPIVSVHGEDVDLELPRLLSIRTTFLSEGLFDEQAGGDPDEEDLYEVEVSHAGDALLEPITFPRLMPTASRSFPAEDESALEIAGSLPMERFLLALAWDLANADPSNWGLVCDAARTWDSWMIEDALNRIPIDWTPEPLRPDEE